MRRGLYKVHFRTQLGSGAGVVVLDNGKILGGDSAMYYVGTYQESGNQFTAVLETRFHTSSMGSVLGVPNARLDIQGTSTGDTATLSGTTPSNPSVRFGAKLERIAD